MNDSVAEIAGTLTLCDQEPIQIPGSVQPHGIMLVAERDGLAVRHAAGDVEGRLGAAGWQGAALAAIIGAIAAERVAALIQSDTGPGFIGQVPAVPGGAFDVSAYPSGDYAIIELEPAATEVMPAAVILDRLQDAATVFEQAATLETLCERAAIAFRTLTGFDRVMVYRFLDDDAGRVLAEARRPDLHSFFNHHFPASDIPRQARALYLRNLTRTIPDIAYRPAPLCPAWTEPEPLDMSDSGLRSVSPVHLHYLANMGVTASASFSVVKDGVLWGLIACHHETPRHVPYDVRIAARALAATLARQIKAKEDAESYRQRIRLRNVEDDIVGLLAREGTLDSVLSNHVAEIGKMLDGDGIAVLRGGELVLGGVHPGREAIEGLVAWLLGRKGEPIYASEWLEQAYPPAAGFRESGSGVLGMVLSAEEPWLLLWFRAEQIEIVKWAGNPLKPTSDESVLTPRASFEAWQETVRGRSRRWSLPELEAARRLRTALLDVQQGRRVRDLNRQLTEILRDKDQLLEQKTFLIGEVNHRVQNSLQLVSSFLSLQARSTESAEARTTLEEARRRLSAVALVHRRLYRGEQVQAVDAARYLEELCADSVASMGDDWGRQLSLDLAPVMIPTDRAVTLGLVLTEWLININKYAYGGASGPVEVRLVEDRAGFILSVGDRGVGRTSSRKGFGSRMIDGLVAQLGGTVEYSDNRPGLRVTLTAPTAPPTRAG